MALVNTRMNDVLLHIKDRNTNSIMDDFIGFPITKYDNVLGRPRVVSTLSNVYGAAFLFYETQEVTLSEEEYSAYFADIQ